MNTETFNKHVEEILSQSIEVNQDPLIFETVATLAIEKGDPKWTALLMQLCAKIGKQFDLNFEELSKEILVNKAKEYAMEDKGEVDRLWNFKDNYLFMQSYPDDNLIGYLRKHLASCMDMLSGRMEMTEYLVKEKFLDVYNYCILLYALRNEEEE